MNSIRFSMASRIFALCMIVVTLAVGASAEWKEKVLYSFQGLPNDGAYPAGGVVFDKAGNVYGATGWGGGDVTKCPGIAQCGIVYELKPPTEKGKAWTETVLYVFKGVNYNDGNTPQGGLIFDQAGNLYGTTSYGGSGSCQLFGGRVGCGTVFELVPPKQKGGKWTEKVLHSFQSGKDGYFPWGDLTFDSKGNLYGATQYGGGYGSCNAPYYQYCGTVFKLSPPKTEGGKWTDEVLYAFKSIDSGKQSGDGANPNGGLVLDSEGALYGTTAYGGYHCPHDNNQGCGTAFALTQPNTRHLIWSETITHLFKGLPDGIFPTAGLALGASGSFYGTTTLGGKGSVPSGTVFELRKQTNGLWGETLVHSFTEAGYEGYSPDAGLTLDSSGNLYGSAAGGGTDSSGTIYRLKASGMPQMAWDYEVLYDFRGPPDGHDPASVLIPDRGSHFYGTTFNGGTGSCEGGGCGTVFQIGP